MMNQSALLNRPSIMQRLLKSIENKVSFGRPRYPPPDDAICECVNDEGHINKALPRGHVGEVADPQQVRCGRTEHTVHLVTRTWCRRVWDRCFDYLSAHSATDADLFHQALHSAACHLKALPLHLMPRLTNAVDLVVLIPHTFNLGAQLRVTLMPRRSFGWISETHQTVVICPLSADCYAIACRAMDGAIGSTLQIDSTP